MFDFLFRILNNKFYGEIAEKTRKRVYDLFWNGHYLKDGLGDSTVRPNIFIAAYVYPDLLSKKEWVTCFEEALNHLWLEWGGLSTISKSDSRFFSKNTGENSASYHRGDSWYWINNMAAIVMHRTDKKKFKRYISKIIEASCEDILFQGYIGNHSELSSAECLSADGCLSQAWSNALFVELAEELRQ